MAATGATNVYDLVSWAKTRDPDSSAALIAELLNQSNEMVQDMVWLEANMPTAHRITQRTALPTTSTRQLNDPVQVSRGQTAQFDEGMSIMENWSEYDLALLKLWADQGQFLYQQNLGFIESLTQKFAADFWYGDPSTNPTQMLGMAPRYSTLVEATAACAQNVIDGGGTSTDNTSLWLVTHAPMALHGIFPKGTPSGIDHQVFGNDVLQGNTAMGGTRLAVHREKWCWNAGVALWDWRWCGRLANIDVSNLRAGVGSADLTEGMIDLMYRVPSIATPPSTTGNPQSSIAIPGKQVFYCNRTVRAALHKQMLNKTNNQLTMDDWYGRKVLHFMGVPLRNSDQILNTEAQVV
ncbi:MAG: hypothetical protein V4636_12910 [Pseudomonadota bacterium]